MVTVCAGIYVNWRYTEDQAAANLTDTLDTEKVMSDDNLVLSEDMAAISAGEDVATTSTDYFAAVRLSRQQARDNAVNLLQEAMSYSESSKEAESAVELEQIVQTARRVMPTAWPTCPARAFPLRWLLPRAACSGRTWPSSRTSSWRSPTIL